MKRNEIESLIEATAQRTAAKVVEQLKGIVRIPGNEDEEYVDAKEAARILGLAPSYVRSQRHRFPHKKVGNSNQGRLLFLKSGLLKNYVK